MQNINEHDSNQINLIIQELANLFQNEIINTYIFVSFHTIIEFFYITLYSTKNESQSVYFEPV